MMLDHDSPLVSPAAEPGVAVEAMPEALPRLSEAAAVTEPQPAVQLKCVNKRIYIYMCTLVSRIYISMYIYIYLLNICDYI